MPLNVFKWGLVFLHSVSLADTKLAEDVGQ